MMRNIRKVEPWPCGHEAAGQCSECYRELAAKAVALAEENDHLRAKYDLALDTLARISREATVKKER